MVKADVPKELALAAPGALAVLLCPGAHAQLKLMLTFQDGWELQLTK